VERTANTLNLRYRSTTLHKTHSPTNIDAILSVGEERLKGRRKLRARDENGAKASPQQPGKVSPTAKGPLSN
jgi:hypothetical protein